MNFLCDTNNYRKLKSFYIISITNKNRIFSCMLCFISYICFPFKLHIYNIDYIRRQIINVTFIINIYNTNIFRANIRKFLFDFY